MLISYIQSIMMIILEVICCKIFFESFAEKRSKNNYRNYSIISESNTHLKIPTNE